MNINNFRGDLTDISAKQEELFTQAEKVLVDMDIRAQNLESKCF